uniref:polyprenyl synthetase family protein n=1 Tax=Flavobacterium sp. TaxID=239 RepID=UPI004049E168
MEAISKLQALFSTYLESKKWIKSPENLYEPVEYILSLGGKRMRPVLTLLATEVFDGNANDALPAALAIEVFHNFSLVHDDIMDDAPLRRGNTTVHEKWDVNTAILSGDAMLILAYQAFEKYEAVQFKALMQLFSQTALEVCEGQQWDVDFETRQDVSESEYLKMISYKTAVLVAAAMKMGAIIAKTSEQQAQLIYDFGLNLGIAFQIQDDYLDAFGNPETFGKQVGGDIIENKKTYLYLKAKELASEQDKDLLMQLFASQPENPTDKIEAVKSIFNDSGATKATQNAVKHYTQNAFDKINQLDISIQKKSFLVGFGNYLMGRTV